jgi:hypothetical protein
MDVVTRRTVAALTLQPNRITHRSECEPSQSCHASRRRHHVGGPRHPTRRSSVAVAIRVPCVKAASGGQLLDV